MSGSFGSDATSKDYISGLDVYATLTDVLYEYVNSLSSIRSMLTTVVFLGI